VRRRAIIIAQLLSRLACNKYASTQSRGKENSMNAYWETKQQKKSRKKMQHKYANIFFPRRKSSIICHLLGLKVSDKSLEESRRWKLAVGKKWPVISGGRNARDIFAGWKTEASARRRYSPPAPERVAGIYRRDFSVKTKTAPTLYFTQ